MATHHLLFGDNPSMLTKEYNQSEGPFSSSTYPGSVSSVQYHICSTPLTVLPYITGRKTPGRRFSGLIMILDCRPSQPLMIRPGESEKAES